MAIEINGKKYRNIQEQVQKNKDDIENLAKNSGFNGPYKSLDDIPEDKLVNNGLYLIGTTSPYGVYKYSEITNTFEPLGQFPQAGPQGPQGPKGATGPQGPQGIQGPQGEPGTKIANIVKTSSVGLVDTYTIIMTDGTTYNFTVTNGKDGRADIEAGTGITINGDEISVDQTVVALKNELNSYLKNNDLTYSGTFRGQAVYVKAEGTYTSTSYGDGSIARSIPRQPGYTYTLPDKSGTFAMTSDIITSYNDLTDKPSIPTKTSDLTNDSGFITSSALTNLVTTTQLNDALDDYALKTDLPENVSDLNNDAGYITSNALSDYVTSDSLTSTLSDYAKLNDDTQNITANTVTVTPGEGYIHTTYGSSNISMSIPRTPGYTLNIPTKNGTLAVTDDIPDVSEFVTETTLTNTLANYELKSEAFSGDYDDLTNKPDLSIYAESADLATVATTGSYNDLLNKPTIPTVDYPVTDVQVDGVSVVSNKVASITMPTVPTKTSDLQNDSGFITGVTWNDVTNKPTFATVATSGSYTDLSNKPNIPDSTSDLTNDSGYITKSVNNLDNYTLTSNLSAVATSGSYNDLSNKPNLSIYAQSANLATVATSGNYNDLSNKPTIPTYSLRTTSQEFVYYLSDNTAVPYTFITSVELVSS